MTIIIAITCLRRIRCVFLGFVQNYFNYFPFHSVVSVELLLQLDRDGSGWIDGWRGDGFWDLWLCCSTCCASHFHFHFRFIKLNLTLFACSVVMWYVAVVAVAVVIIVVAIVIIVADVVVAAAAALLLLLYCIAINVGAAAYARVFVYLH